MVVAQAAAVVSPVVAAAAPSVSRRPSSRGASGTGGGLGWRRRRRGGTGRGLVIVDAFGGTYEDGFGDVELEIMNYFTYKATKTVLYQLYEMNPPAYTWLYNYLVDNDAKEGIHFLRALTKERQDLAERVMVTRLHLYGRWIKKCDHTKMYEMISNENLELMRERLIETVVWPSDDMDTTCKQD
ncbi:chaperonin-like RbcX protein 2, chloroplastic [Lolium rigidum]|uniref:chaperonin-like RbcX protein 2, chloroplastic n=1 Tax=Lolium rigidum TaxID=89674 RepID=UPI001F5D5D45|nr:chaperonin-like RbcX protein 2, chloroplastic [Lolium rigidum]